MKSLPIWERKILRNYCALLWLFLAMTCFPPVLYGHTILDKKISVHFSGITVGESLEIISEKANCHFIYSTTLFSIHRKVSARYQDTSIRDILSSLLGDELATIQVKGNTVLLIAAAGHVTGQVLDQNNNPIPFAAVVLEGTQNGVVTDENGAFELRLPASGAWTLVVSALGYTGLKEKIQVNPGQTHKLTLQLTEQSVEMNEVVVMANRQMAFTATKSLTPIKDLPMPVMLVEGKQLEIMGSRRLNEVLQEQTGLALTTDPSGASSSLGLQVQGFDASYTMIMIDGQPLIGRNSVGILDLSRITVANIDCIEIIKGTSSAMYGSDALAGVVNIITKGNSSRGTQGIAAIRYGTNNTLDATLDGSTSIIQNKLSGAVSANFYRTDGFDADTSTPGQTLPPFHSYALQGKLNYRFGTTGLVKTSIRYALRDQRNKYDLDLLGRREDINVEKDLTATTLVQNSIGKNTQLQTQYYFTQYEANTSATDLETNTELGQNKFRQHFHRFESYANHTLGEALTLTTGAGINAEILNAARYGNQRQMNNGFAYIQADYKPLNSLGLLGGLRYDLHNIYGWQLSPRLGIRYTVNDKLILKGTAGTGFKAPSFQQLYLSFTNPSAGYTVLGAAVFKEEIERMQHAGEIRDLYPVAEQIDDLKAEHSLSFNAGLMWMPSSSIALEVNAFHNNIDNMIFEELIGMKQNGSQVYSYRNIEQAYTQGLETNIKWEIVSGLELSAGYQLLHAKDKGVIEAIKAGETQVRTPEGHVLEPSKSDYFNLSNRSRHMANIKVFYEYMPWGAAASIRANYRGKYGIGDRNYPNNFIDPYDLYAKGYVLLNATVEKRFYDGRIGVQLICDNITNYNDHLIPNLPGRQFLVALSWRFQSDKNQKP